MALINLVPALEKAKTIFSQKDAEAMALKAGVTYNTEKKEFAVPFLGQDYRVVYPDGEVYYSDSNSEVIIEVKILILHYLYGASGVDLQNKLISFKELPDGFIYIEPFTNRAIRPLVGIFGNIPDKMLSAGEKLGGERLTMGDASITIPVFPRVPVTFILWLADEEFPANGNVLFDASAPRYLDTEDYALLPSLVIGAMKKLAFN
ncbi:hypothetical protein Dtox_1693 [Desulfofarcimen acetoxidans DSM 771]|jgi:hypothetical protein|uniref:DUF3786 domain-containing protein n=1 Tax=Desulfofarcimen acetoxidans (strain ATCC 49208 / DSM 771 / KCTC 5769 / VKM B-1644 / 5575) TaxID=485916 RepID=C8VWX4_DESAS|nr:DUF3786 domain-containing protein [Desulfofarcimen acetoxidans]ACV62550.1 hypothetical protein Dtox_1693 [Desulfofarcimen acetoxidans DSM 771]